MVIDASGCVEYLLRTSVGDQIGSIVEAPDTDLHVPAFCDVDVCAVLTALVEDGTVTFGRARHALTDYLDLPLTRHGHSRLLPRAMLLADRFSPFDAIYVALCEHLGATLVTGDPALTRSAGGLLNVIGVTD